MSSDQSTVSVETKIATVGVILDALKTSIMEHLGRQDNTMDRIETNLVKLNGRTGKTEEDVRNLNRMAVESITAAKELEGKQAADHKEIGRIRRQIWRWATTLSILAGLGFGIVWLIDHGVIQVKASNYHAVSQ
jgi:hypothetical protein